MPLKASYTPAPGTNGGIEKKSIAQILSKRLQDTWDPAKTTLNIQANTIWFDYTQGIIQDTNIPQSRSTVVRVMNGRTNNAPLEPGMFNVLYTGSPAIHVFVRDQQATLDGDLSKRCEDMAQYIRNWIADNKEGFQNEGVHWIDIVDQGFIPETQDPNYHHWYILLSAGWEMYYSPT